MDLVVQTSHILRNGNWNYKISKAITLPAGAVAKYCDEYDCLCVCLAVCLFVRENIFATTRAIFTKYFAHAAYVHGSVLLRHVDDRPHRLSAGRGDGSAQRGRSVIYDCLVYFSLLYA